MDLWGLTGLAGSCRPGMVNIHLGQDLLETVFPTHLPCSAPLPPPACLAQGEQPLNFHLVADLGQARRPADRQGDQQQPVPNLDQLEGVARGEGRGAEDFEGLLREGPRLARE